MLSALIDTHRNKTEWRSKQVMKVLSKSKQSTSTDFSTFRSSQSNNNNENFEAFVHLKTSSRPETPPEPGRNAHNDNNHFAYKNRTNSPKGGPDPFDDAIATENSQTFRHLPRRIQRRKLTLQELPRIAAKLSDASPIPSSTLSTGIGSPKYESSATTSKFGTTRNPSLPSLGKDLGSARTFFPAPVTDLGSPYGSPALPPPPSTPIKMHRKLESMDVIKLPLPPVHEDEQYGSRLAESEISSPGNSALYGFDKTSKRGKNMFKSLKLDHLITHGSQELLLSPKDSRQSVKREGKPYLFNYAVADPFLEAHFNQKVEYLTYKMVMGRNSGKKMESNPKVQLNAHFQHQMIRSIQTKKKKMVVQFIL
eukprot:TRINITY_DN7075_c0_g1_i1.p1 TRINITY_DN7075_c0_g1~~TRINITY_DN7075_c0_g1_i1.p1  ORF type:complete len:366 (-),score=31.18 TRINITY_DN7075_c0_g1_i1:278-1375(-)